MKRRLVIIIVIFICLTFTVRVDAADLLWRLTHGDQDALIVGEIVDKKGVKFIVKVHHVIDGDMKEESIVLDSQFRYRFLGGEAKVDDYVVLSVDREGSKYKLRLGAFKTKSSDYKILKLYKTGLTERLKADLAVFEYYINSNGQENNYYFRENNAYIRKSNGDILHVYPKSSNSSELLTTDILNQSSDIAHSKNPEYISKSNIDNRDIDENHNNKSYNVVGGIVVIFLIIIVAIYTTIRRKKF